MRPDIPYHRLARTDRYRWWHPIVGSLLVALLAVLAVAVVYVGAGLAGMALGLPRDGQGWPVLSAEVELALGLIGLALIIPIVLLAARVVQQRPAGTVSSVTGRLRWRRLGRSALVAVPLVGLMYLILFLLPGDGGDLAWVGWERFLAGLAVVLVLTPFQAAGEEYLFRGWLLQAFGSWTRSPWPGIAVSAAGFGLLHGYGTPWGMVDLVFFGVVAAVLTIRTGGLEAAIVLHTVGNLAAFAVAAAAGMLDSDQTATDAGALLALVDMAMVTVYAAVILTIERQSRLSR